jgi:protocatechuate 3,4-dioxygenase alpha subunit
MLHATSSQTIGPFWHLLEDPDWTDLTRFGATGEVITVEGRVLDGAGTPLSDACVEIWQASPETCPSFPGFGRAATDAQGVFRFRTMARGLLVHLTTRIYFAGDPHNAADPVLNLIEDPTRRATLIAQQVKPGVWQRDIHLQGAAETIFFNI